MFASDVYILYIAISYILLKDFINVLTLHGITIRQKCICSKVKQVCSSDAAGIVGAHASNVYGIGIVYEAPYVGQ